MSKGWISLHRKFMDSPFYGKPDYVAVWLHFLLKANHSEKKVMIGNQTITVKRGQFISGRKKLSEQTGVSESKVNRIIKFFKSEQQIEQQSFNKFSLFSIVNYSQYQDPEHQNEQQMNSKRTASEQQVNTNNNVNNENNNINNKNKKEPSAKPPKKTLDQKVSEKYGIDLSLINRFTKHRRELKKPIKTEKEIVLAIRGLQKCVDQGYYASLDAAMDRLDDSTWLVLKPDYVAKEFNLTGGQKPTTPAGETFEQMELRRDQEKRRDRYLRLKLRANEFGVYIDENSDFDLVEEEITNIERNKQFSEFMQ